MATIVISPETAMALEISMDTLSVHTYSCNIDSAERAEPQIGMGGLRDNGVRSRATASRSGPQSHESPRVSAEALKSSREEGELVEGSAAATSLDTSAWARFRDALIPQWAIKQTTEEKRAYEIHRGLNKLVLERVDDFPEGIPQLAAIVNSGDSFALFRRFGQLTSRALLHKTIELAELEKELSDMDNDNNATDDKIKKLRLKGLGDSNGWGKREEDLVEDISKKLQDYFALLLAHSQVNALGRPPPHQPKNLYTWMWDEKPLADNKAHFACKIDDFVSVAHSPNGNAHASNRLESLIDRYPGLPLKKFLQGKRELAKTDDPYMEHFSPERFDAVVKTVTVLVAVSVLLVPVLLLFLVPMSRQLMAWLVFGFVLMFSVIMAALTQAQIHQILVGTAAYGAVLVTFLGNMNRGDGA